MCSVGQNVIQWDMAFKTKPQRRSSSASITIGRRDFAKISEVEGIKLSARVEKDFREFDREGLSASERRCALTRKYSPKR